MPLYKTMLKKERSTDSDNENSIDHCGKRLQWRRRYSGRYKNNDHEWCICHECDHSTYSAEHDRRDGDSGIDTGFPEAAN